MASKIKEKPLITIVGPTASGKTGVAIRLAKKIDGEIISADSRTVYKGMDIGTAKPTSEEQSGVPHFGIDLVEPDHRFTAADFQAYAKRKMLEIRSRGKVPIIVGGTGLYIDSVLFDYEFGAEADPVQRELLQSKSVEELQKYCKDSNIELPKNYLNKRHLVRAIELNGANHKSNKSITNNAIVVGISIDRGILRQRIEVRTDKMFAQGVVDEAIVLAAKYGWTHESMTGSVYRIIRQLLDNEITLEQAKSLNITRDMQLAKRQMTWFKRNTHIQWCSDADDLLAFCIAHLK